MVVAAVVEEFVEGEGHDVVVGVGGGSLAVEVGGATGFTVSRHGSPTRAADHGATCRSGAARLPAGLPARPTDLRRIRRRRRVRLGIKAFGTTVGAHVVLAGVVVSTARSARR